MAAEAEPAAQEVNDDENEEEEVETDGAAEVERALAGAAIAGQADKARQQAHPKSAVSWPEGPSSEGQNSVKLYRWAFPPCCCWLGHGCGCLQARCASLQCLVRSHCAQLHHAALQSAVLSWVAMKDRRAGMQEGQGG